MVERRLKELCGLQQRDQSRKHGSIAAPWLLPGNRPTQPAELIHAAATGFWQNCALLRPSVPLLLLLWKGRLRGARKRAQLLLCNGHATVD